MWRRTAILAAIAVVLCWHSGRTAKTLNVEKSVSNLAEANIRFGIKLYKQLVKDEAVKNTMFSPISISAAMAMAHLGAKGETAKQIDDAFMFSRIEQGKFHSAFGELYGLMFDKTSENVTLKFSNRVFINKVLGVLEDYKNALTVYGAQVNELDFADSATSVAAVNTWIQEATEGKITKILSDKDLGVGAAMLLANTIYFKGEWHSKFVESQTEKRAFYVTAYKVVQTPFMFQRGQFRYGYVPSLTLQILEMQYAGEDFNMIIMLPENFDLKAVEREMNYENLTNWLSNLEYQSIDLTLPKFKLEETLRLHEILPELGVTDVFDSKKADLSGISAQASHVDQILHKSVLEVEEKGGDVKEERAETERAKNIIVVYADHPFIILIQSKSSKAFHLMGAYKRPHGRLRSHDEL